MKRFLRGKKFPTGMVVSLALMIAVFAVVWFGMGSASEARSEEAARVLEDSIRRAAVCCYAIEGRYPDTVEYIIENYGVYVNDKDYAVFYEVFATNIMPDITIIER